MGQQQSLACEIDIEAPPALVHEIFMDFPRYKEWHPEWEIKLPATVAQPSQLREGDRLNIKMPGFGFSAVITKNTPDALQWLGSLPYIFTGAHGFDFAPSEKTPGGTRFVQMEEFSGLAAFMMAPGWSFRDSTQAGWTAFNESLKREAEKQAKARAAA